MRFGKNIVKILIHAVDIILEIMQYKRCEVFWVEDIL